MRTCSSPITVTRRALVAGGPAAIIATSLPAPAVGARDDAALLALQGPYDHTMAGMAAANPAHTAAENAYFAAKRTRPDLDERALRKISGLVTAERVWRRAVDANTAVIEHITETPAHTLAGLVFKARVAEADSLNPDLAASIVTDLLTMKKLA